MYVAQKEERLSKMRFEYLSLCNVCTIAFTDVMLLWYHKGDFFACSFLGWLVINLYNGLLASNSFVPFKAAIADQWRGNSW